MPSLKLTDKTLKGLKAPKSGQIDIWDELLSGFGVRIGTTGRKSFFVGTRVNGHYRRITLSRRSPLWNLPRPERRQGRSSLTRRAALAQR